MTPPHTIHPAADLFPMMPDDQLEILAADIKKQGLIYPIILLDGEILDGRNRLKACGMAGVKPTFSEYNDSRTPTEYVISVNCKRRDLTLSQRAMIAANALPMLEAEARQRMAAGGGDKKSGKEIIPDPIKDAGQARDKAATIANVNPRYVSDAKKLKAESPEIAAEVAAGTKTLPEAKREVASKTNGFCRDCQQGYKLVDGHECKKWTPGGPAPEPREHAPEDSDDDLVFTIKRYWKKTTKKQRKQLLQWFKEFDK